MSGAEAADKIKNLHDVPIIFLTVFIKNIVWIKSLGIPEDVIILSKPIKQEHLEYGISRALRAVNKTVEISSWYINANFYSFSRSTLLEPEI